MIARLLLALVGFYRRVLSPLKGRPTCRFLPTCSEYAQDALRTHGAWRGGRLAAWRLLRCHPFCAGGHDPVPPPASDELVGRVLSSSGKKLHGRHR